MGSEKEICGTGGRKRNRLEADMPTGAFGETRGDGARAPQVIEPVRELPSILEHVGEGSDGHTEELENHQVRAPSVVVEIPPLAGRPPSGVTAQEEEARRLAIKGRAREVQDQVEVTEKQAEERLAREEASLMIEEEHARKLLEELAEAERLSIERSLRSQALATLAQREEACR